MSWFCEYYSTSQGKKMVMAITGLIMFGYVFFHMLGNMQIYLPSPPDHPEPGYYINRYAEFLHSTTFAPFLWIVRIVLFICLFMHVLAATQLTLQTWKTRGVRYKVRRYLKADIAARTMVFSGPIIALFLLYHILHLTTGHLAPEGFQEAKAYQNLVIGFRNPTISGIYIFTVVVLGFHFYHALWSWFQTLGLAHPTHNPSRRWLSTALTIILVIADLSYPISVLTGLVGGDVR